MLTREEILAAAGKTTIETIHVEALGGAVQIRAMTGRERDAWESSLVKGRGKKQRTDTSNARASLAVRVLCNEKGERLFTNEEAELLGTLPAAVLAPIYEAAQRLNGVSDDDVDELEQSSAPSTGSAPGATSPSA